MENISDASGREPYDLDRAFGEAIMPHRCDPIESEAMPNSLHVLDEGTASLLKKFMSITVDGLGVTRFVYNSIPILWVINENGEFVFAMEEIFDGYSREYLYPKPRGFMIPLEYYRLGHPALLGGNKGRIGGELKFDPLTRNGVWVLSNESGRFGTRPGRREEHLDSVAKMLDRFHIYVVTHFVGTVGR